VPARPPASPTPARRALVGFGSRLRAAFWAQAAACRLGVRFIRFAGLRRSEVRT
jgi:hypothetical protein